MTKLILITLVFLVSSAAIAGPDCSPKLRAKGLAESVLEIEDTDGMAFELKL
jgi:hypothetical protein